MATYNNGAGVFSYGNTTAANVADTVTFVDRFDVIQVYNASNTNELYIRADGNPASDAAGETGSMIVPPNSYALIANGFPMWQPSSRVTIAGHTLIPQGGGGTALATSPTNSAPNAANPGYTSPYGASPTGGVANPGTSVSILSTGAVSYVVAVAG